MYGIETDVCSMKIRQIQNHSSTRNNSLFQRITHPEVVSFEYENWDS